MRKAINLGLTFLLIISLCGCAPKPANSNNSDKSVKLYKILKVIDGDTIEIDYNQTKERVRFIGIDTPESVHPDKSKNSELGVAASDFAKSRLIGKEVSLEFDVEQRDIYQRLLAYVYLDGKMFNKTLLEEGYAKIYTFPPNVKYTDDFLKLERKAREENKGLWSFWGAKANKAESSLSSKDVVYVTKSGKKYHKENCSSLKSEKTEIAKQEALDKGFTACKVCNP